MPRRLQNDTSGIILVMVLIIVAVMSVLAIGILSMQVTRVQSGQDVVQSIQAEYWGRRLLWEIYANNLNGLAIAPTASTTIDGRTYSATITPTPPNQYQIDITY